MTLPAWVRLLPLCGFLAVAAGCSTKPLPPMANAEEARAALTTALDAWKKGERRENLAARTPPIYFNDPKCTPDTALISYKLADGSETHGQSVRISVALNLKSKDGSTRERNAAYLIDTSPALVIVPD